MNGLAGNHYGAFSGLCIRGVKDTLRYNRTCAQIASDINDEFIKGIAKLEDRLVILIDIDRLMKKS